MNDFLWFKSIKAMRKALFRNRLGYHENYFYSLWVLFITDVILSNHFEIKFRLQMHILFCLTPFSFMYLFGLICLERFKETNTYIFPFFVPDLQELIRLCLVLRRIRKFYNSPFFVTLRNLALRVA